MKLKIIFLAFLLLFTPLLSGCWDYEEYENLVQVTGIGFDYNKETNEITYTVQYIPTAKGGGMSSGSTSSSATQQKQIVHSFKGKGIFDVVNESQQVINKKIFYGYLKVLIFSEETAKYKMRDIIELLHRSPVIRSSTYILITPGKAKDTLSTFDLSQTGSAQEIYNLTNLAEPMGSAYPVTLLNMAQMLVVPGIEPSAPRVVTASVKQQTDVKGGKEENFENDLEREGSQRVAGMAVFQGSKLIGWFNDKESMGFGWITGKKLQVYKVENRTKDTDTENLLFFRVKRASGKIKVKIENGQPVFQVNVKATGFVEKYYTKKGTEFILLPEGKKLEEAFAKNIRADIDVALRAGQKRLKSDVFGFGFALYRKDPKLWKSEYEDKWKYIFPDVKVKINVDAKIINTGTVNRRLDLK